ncbi:MAG: transcriptional regulator [Nitrospirae bacterium RIFCSPLOWO2_12_FULL_63_8]|nr:MAG: transcriptional regulator [Nitrospirae bacterium RIFCSPLOWO2_12_FULL_63_8]
MTDRTARILIVDDEKNIRTALASLLRKQGYDAQAEGNPETAPDLAAAGHFNIVITDLKMQPRNGIEVLEEIRRRTPDSEVVIMTAYATVETAVEAIKKGAYDYVTKPVDPDRLIRMIEQILELQSLKEENVALRRRLSLRDQYGRLIGASVQMRQIFRIIDGIAATPATVLITGESGTGKELVAKAIHERSPRAKGPFVAINCGAIPEALLESELFGSDRGAFTGADRDRPGRIEMASGGTLFLDEVGEMSARTQVEFLRVLQERELRRLGGSRLIKVDVRIIAATNKDLQEEIRQGRFREDLFYRLHVVPIDLPSLRERSSDIPLLAQAFNEEFCKAYDKPVKEYAAQSMDLLEKYPWPGNVRELRNAIERITLLVRADTVQARHVQGIVGGGEDPQDEVSIRLGTPLRDVEEQLIRRTLERVTSHRERAAKLLGISPRALHYKLRRYGIDANDSDETGP